MTDKALARTVYNPPRAAKGWALADYVGHDRIRVFSVARWALAEALRLIDAAGRKVLVPDFICREVLASLKQAGAEPAFYAVGKNLKPAFDPAALPEAVAILAVDYFGFAQDMAPFEEYALRTRATVIEDNAHGLLSRDAQGRALGTRAKLGLLSMRKTLAIPDGGALLLNAANLADKARPQISAAEKPAAGLAFMRRRKAARSLARWIGARPMVSAINGARFLRKLRTGSDLPVQDPEAERWIGVRKPPSAAALAPYRCADVTSEAARRRALFLLSSKLLSTTSIEPVFSSLPENTVPYVYPFRVDAAHASAAEKALKSHGLFSLPWPALPDAVAASAAEYHKTVRGVQFLW